MIFALGFLFAGLLTLLFLPVFWRRALRLSRRRLEMQMPLSMTEIMAERDQLRAEFALERRKLEQRFEALHEARTRDLSELGRRAATLVSMEEERDALTRTADALRNDLEEARRLSLVAEDELAAALNDAYQVTGLVDRRSEALGRLPQDGPDDLSAERRATIAGLELLADGLRAGLTEAQEALAIAQLQLAEKMAAAKLLAHERDEALADLALGHAKRETLLRTNAEMNVRIAEKENAVRAVQREQQRMAREIQDLGKTLEAAQAQENDLRASAERQAASVREDTRAQAERLQAMRAQRDALEGALTAARHEVEILREKLAARTVTPIASAEARRSAEDALLRQAISDVGAEVTRLAGALERDVAADPQAPLAERMRELQSVAGRGARSAG